MVKPYPTCAIITVLILGIIPQAFSNLEYNGSYRLRFEHFDNTLRAGSDGYDHAAMQRVQIQVKYSHDDFHIVGELQDARVWGDDVATPLGVDDVDTFEPIQLHIGWTSKTSEVKIGRFTQNIGDRRLVSRTNFRNTNNTFTGINGYHQLSAFTLQWIYAASDYRFPRDSAALRDADIQLNKTDFDNIFRGIHITHQYSSSYKTEWFWFGLREDDQAKISTRNRNIDTFGFRLVNEYSEHEWGYEISTAYQTGHARASSDPVDMNDLNVEAYFLYLALGYRFNDSLQSNMRFEFNYATGDEDTNDNELNKFDSLFGVRRFDFGATGLYGTLGRSNIISPSIRWQFAPNINQSAFLSYRAVWLASSNDVLNGAGGVDLRNSVSENFVGHQLEGRYRWQLNDRVQFEAGLIYLIQSDFFDNTQSAFDSRNSTYSYLQFTYSF